MHRVHQRKMNCVHTDSCRFSRGEPIIELVEEARALLQGPLLAVSRRSPEELQSSSSEETIRGDQDE